MPCLPSLAPVLLHLGAILRRRSARHLLPLLSLGLALPSLRAATLGDFQYTDTGKAITLTKYLGTEQVVAIPGTIAGKPVTSIGDEAFAWGNGLTSITIPDSITSIGDASFQGCSGLTSITIPQNVTSIGNRAFSYSGLTSVTILARVTSLGVSTFDSCSYLASITIPDSVTSIGNSAFYGCGELTSITIPGKVTAIGSSAFNGCSGLTSITIPDRVTSLGDYAFHGCSALTRIDVATTNSVYASVDGVLFTKALTTLLQYPPSKLQTTFAIPSSVTAIKDYAFAYCSVLTRINIPNSVTSIGIGVFVNSTLTSIIIPAGITSIGDMTFYGCAGLTSVTLPNSVTSIGDMAFYECSSLTSITLPGNVTSIGALGFCGCSKLSSVTIPGSVTAIVSEAFDGCTRLAGAIFLGNAPALFGSDVFANTATDFWIYYPSNSSGFTSPTWNGYNTRIGFPTFAQWIAGFGLGASDRAPEANPAGDGLPNLVKYALGLDPTKTATDGRPVLVPENGKYVFRATRWLQTTGITTTMQTSADLVNWSAVPATIESTTTTTVTATVTLPTGTPRRFARLVVTQP